MVAPHRRFVVFIGTAVVALAGMIHGRSQSGPYSVPGVSRQPERDDPPVFEKDILPVLQAKCLQCHGDQKRKGNLDLRTRSGVMQGGESGDGLKPGSLKESILWEKIATDKMPPGKDKLSAAEKEIIKRWIETGARGNNKAPAAPLAEVSEVSDADRDFWAFRKPVRPTVPAVQCRQQEVVRNPLDAFILAALHKKQLTFSPEAGRHALLRRVTFDLTGLPPTPQEIDTFMTDTSPDAYEKAVDRLLASPHYGERWGRHWLDLAGYADTEGILDEDRTRSAAWRYRDYVIRAFNSDKPYDLFLQEQLAGDELVDYWQYEKEKELSPQVIEALVATGFLRCASDPSRPDFVNIKHAPEYYWQTLDDTVKIVSSSTLGLTVHCAKCHSHKYDPIPQTDYYRLQAIFMSGYRPSKWIPQEQRRLTVREQGKPKPFEVRAFYDLPGEAKTYLLRRGDYLNPGPEVKPGTLSVLAASKPFDSNPAPEPKLKLVKSSGRRLAFARWLTQDDHPLTARVLVNRLWLHHFGEGIVATPDNFGRTGSAPSHPELLDWLACEFTNPTPSEAAPSPSRWSIKRMHRLIVTSATYRQASLLDPAAHILAKKIDPDNRLLWRQRLRRLDAEAMRDALLSSAGNLNPEMFGPPVPMRRQADGRVVVAADASGAKRSIYLQVRRLQPLTFLQLFDQPIIETNCARRETSTVASQALTLLNSDFMIRQADIFADRLLKESPTTPAAQAVLLALGRPAAAKELRLLESFVENQSMRHLQILTGPDAAATAAQQTDARRRALSDLCQMLLSSNEFAYVD